MDVNKENLENALSGPEASEAPKPDQPQAPPMSKEMEVGFHQGALNTLANERNELVKIPIH